MIGYSFLCACGIKVSWDPHDKHDVSCMDAFWAAHESHDPRLRSAQSSTPMRVVR